IFNFIRNYKEDRKKDYLIICSEGLYNIRKQILDNKKINVNENKLYKEIGEAMRKSQNDAIKKYGVEFTTYEFYSKISQDKKYIDDINSIMNKYKMQIDFFSRIKDSTGKWIIDSIHLPVFITEHV